MKHIFQIVLVLGLCNSAFGAHAKEDTVGHTKNYISNTFYDSRVINGHSVETLKRGIVDFRVSHKFNDIAGANGGFHTFYGLDNLSDVRIGFEYGISDDLMIGLGRSKGDRITELIDVFYKYKILSQVEGGMPFTIAVFQDLAYSAKKASIDPTSETAFKKFPHRLSYVTQVLIARKFGDRVSLQFTPSYVHRNFVAAGDENNMYGFGMGGRFALNKVFALVGEYHFMLPHNRIVNGIEYRNPSALGLEIKTGVHVFHLNFSNSRGIIENEFLPLTFSRWGDGEFRLGFSISRQFRVK